MTKLDIEISQSETSALIANATREHPLPLKFGGNRVWLMTGKPGSVHALQKLAELRGMEAKIRETIGKTP